MEKYHKVFSIAFAFAFLILLQQFPTLRPLFRILAATFVVFAIVLSLYNRWYLKKIGKYNSWLWAVPTFFYTSAFVFFLAIPTDFLKGLLLILAVTLGSLFEIFLGNFSENFSLNQHLIMAFGFFFAFCALNFYFPTFYVLSLLGVFISSTILIRSFYEFLPKSNKVKLVSSLSIGLFCSEFFWALSFLPFHFSILALFLFNLFYLCLILNYYFVFQTLTFKKLQFHLALIIGCSALALIVTPWKILT
jgi:hypothetical protein